MKMIPIFQHKRIINKANPRRKTTKQVEEPRKMGLDNRRWQNSSWEHPGKTQENETKSAGTNTRGTKDDRRHRKHRAQRTEERHANQTTQKWRQEEKG